MKTLRFLTLFALAVLCCVGRFVSETNASEVSDKFNGLVGKMASENDNDRKNAQQDWMKFVLQTNDGPTRLEACELMLNQVQAPDTPVETAVWLIRQVGYIGPDFVAPGLESLMKHENIRIRDEAARVLAWIPGRKAAEALKSADSPLAKDALAEKNLDRDVLKKAGNETVMPMALANATATKAAAWMTKYDSLDDLGKARTLAGLTKLGNKKYLPQALAAAKSENEVLRDAGLLAVEELGGAKEIPMLLEVAFGADQKSLVANNSRDLAKDILARMIDNDFDEQLVRRLKSEKDFGRFEVLADVLSRRFNVASKPVILVRAKAADCPNRLSMIRIAENLSTKDDIGDFVDVWQLITDRGQRDQAEQIVARLVDGDSDAVLAKRNAGNYAAFFSLLGRIGDDKSLEEIRNRVFDKPLGAGMTSSPELKAAALRALCNWPDGRVAGDLLGLASNDQFSESDRIAALRGMARVASLPNDQIRIKINDEGKVALLGKGMELARRIDEKRLIIQRVGQVRCVDSLKFVLKYFDDAELQDAVCQSILDLAHHTDLRRRDKEAFTAALEKVLAVTKDNRKIERANNYKDNF